MKKYDVANTIDNPYEMDDQEEGETLFDIDNGAAAQSFMPSLSGRPHASSYFSMDSDYNVERVVEKS